MPKKRSTRSTKSNTNAPAEPTPANAKLCEECGTVNSFKRVKCEKCSSLLPEGKFERSKRLRQQALRRQQQSTMGASLFSDTPGFSGAFAFSDEAESGGSGPESSIEEVLSSKNDDEEESGRTDAVDSADDAELDLSDEDDIEDEDD